MGKRRGPKTSSSSPSEEQAVSMPPPETPIRDSFLSGLVDILQKQNQLQGEQMREMLKAHGSSSSSQTEVSQQPAYKQFMTFRPAEFKGSTDPMVAEEWLQSMETIFDFMQLGPTERVSCASFMFKDDARIWWTGTKTTLDLSTTSWENFKEVFYGKYFTLSTRSKLAREFLEIRQGEGSVADYVKRFERGKYFAPLIVGDATMEQNHFFEGLNASIRKDIRSNHSSSMRETIDCALMAEKDNLDVLREAQAKRSTYSGRDTQGPPMKRPFQQSYNSNAPSHQSRTSWPDRYPPRPQQHQNRPQQYHSRPQQQQQRPQQQLYQQHQRRLQSARPSGSGHSSNAPAPMCNKCGKSHVGDCLQGSNVCFICKQKGHFQRDCPQQRGTIQGRVYSMNETEVNPDATIISGNDA